MRPRSSATSRSFQSAVSLHGELDPHPTARSGRLTSRHARPAHHRRAEDLAQPPRDDGGLVVGEDAHVDAHHPRVVVVHDRD
jgi:hypothetical protein